MTSARHVRRLCLVAPDGTLLGRGRTLVEDALRTASLPEADGGRIYIVRRLDLGAIDPARPPGTVALVIERRFAALRARAVHAASAGARGAEVVYFHDAVEPFIWLIRRSVSGPPADEWFWRLAVRGYLPGQARDQALRIGVVGACATPGRGAAALVELAAVLGRDEVDALCEVLRPIDGPALLAGLRDGGGRGSGAGAVGPLQSVPPPRSLRSLQSIAWRDLLKRWMRQWGPEDLRTLWLAAVAIGAQSPGRAVADQRRLMSRAVAAVQAEVDEAAHLGEPGEAREAGGADRSRRTPDAAQVDDTTVAGRSTPPVDDGVVPPGPGIEARARTLEEAPTRDAELLRGDGPGGAPRMPPKIASAPARPDRARVFWEGTPVPTAAGGLLFLIRPLGRLGFPGWLDDQPVAAEADLAARLLCHVARRVGIDDDDPGLAPWTVADPAELAAPLRAALDIWCVRLARWLRRHARLSLRGLVRRPGRIIATRTHVDVLLAMRDADVRVRAAGLDVDPGWVPWLGRVVQFHYQDGH